MVCLMILIIKNTQTNKVQQCPWFAYFKIGLKDYQFLKPLIRLIILISFSLKSIALSWTNIWVTGGKFGAKEPMEQLVSNLQNFQRFLYGEDLERPELLALFNSKQYEAVSRIICGKDHPFYKRVQVNLILMLPGHSRN